MREIILTILYIAFMLIAISCAYDDYKKGWKEESWWIISAMTLATTEHFF